jgi:mono/diheme cytochrome c family protein
MRRRSARSSIVASIAARARPRARRAFATARSWRPCAAKSNASSPRAASPPGSRASCCGTWSRARIACARCSSLLRARRATGPALARHETAADAAGDGAHRAAGPARAANVAPLPTGLHHAAHRRSAPRRHGGTVHRLRHGADVRPRQPRDPAPAARERFRRPGAGPGPALLRRSAGARRPARRRRAQLARANVAAFASADLVINNSAGCGCAMKEYGHLLGTRRRDAFARKCRDISEFLAKSDSPPPRRQHAGRAAYDDPCHLCHGPGRAQQPRAPAGPGAGAPARGPRAPGGLLRLGGHLQPAATRARRGNRPAEGRKAARRSASTSSSPAIPGCMLQIDSHLRAAGHSVPVRHPVELLLPPE